MSMRITRGAVVAAVTGALVTGLAAFALQAPRRVEISSAPACGGCSIELTRVATLGQPDDSLLLGPQSLDVATDGGGRFVAVASTHDRLLVFDSTGALVRSVGRHGQGPGEFTVIQGVRSATGDSVYVAARGLPTRVLTPNLEAARAIQTRSGLDTPDVFRRAAFLRSGDIVAQSDPGTAQVLRGDGSVVRTLTMPTGTRAEACTQCERRWFSASAEPGRFWTTVSNRFEIDQFDVQGRHHVRLMRRADWFRPWREDAPFEDPNARVGAMRESADGLLWIAVYVPDPARTPMTAEDSLRSISHLMVDRQNDVVLEVIDPRSGRLLASRRLPGTIGFIGRDLLFTSGEDPDGVVSLTVWRVAVRRP